jgi:hypothetical protein
LPNQLLKLTCCIRKPLWTSPQKRSTTIGNQLC